MRSGELELFNDKLITRQDFPGYFDLRLSFVRHEIMEGKEF